MKKTKTGFYIIVRGPAGVGKSTISQKLAKKLNAHYVELDDIRLRHNLKSAKKYRLRANRIAIPEIIENIEKGRIVVVDDIFYHKEVLDDFIKHLPYDHYAFTLKAPVSHALYRNNNRSKKLRKKVVKDAHNLVSRFDYGIIIDNTKTLSKSLEQIISYLPKKAAKLAKRVAG